MKRAMLIAGLAAALAGCAQPKPALLTAPEPAIVWPKPPDAARIRYLGELTSSRDVHPAKSLGQLLDEAIHGPAKPVPLVSPHAVAVHADGNRVAIADPSPRCVHVFDIGRQTYECKLACGELLLGCPSAVAWAGDTLLVADAEVPGVAVFETSPSTGAGAPGRGGGASKQGEWWFGNEVLKRPAGLAYCPQNELVYVSDAAEHAVVAFDRSGEVAVRFGSRGANAGQFNGPTQLAIAGDLLVVVDSLNFRVQRFGLDGGYLSEFGAKGDASGDLALPKGVAIDAEGNIWIVDAQFENVQAFTPDGKLLMVFGQEGHEPGEFWLPAGACFDGKRRLWVADKYNRRVQVFGMVE